MLAQPLRRRTMGTETEYGIIMLDSAGQVLQTDGCVWAKSFFDFLFEHYRLKPWRVFVSDSSTSLITPDQGRLYADHCHPEWSTPEVEGPLEGVLRDKGSEYWLGEAITAFNKHNPAGWVLKLHKNNFGLALNNVQPTALEDYKTYGGHCNFLIYSQRIVPLRHYIRGLLPLFSVMQVMCGAGGVLRLEDGRPSFVISNRAPFMWQETGIETTHLRPIFNTKDEPWADRGRFRRLHVISQDVNISQVAIFLKLGLITAGLDTVECGCCPGSFLKLGNAVKAIKQIALDPGLTQMVELAGGQQMTALKILDIYLSAFERHYSRHDSPESWVPLFLRLAREIWLGLIDDPFSQKHRLDWVMKLWLINESGGLAQAKAEEIDQGYHQLGGRLHTWLGRSMSRLFEPEEIRGSVQSPPPGRPAVRETLMNRYPYLVASDWERLFFKIDSCKHISVVMPDPREIPEEVRAILELPDYESVMNYLNADAGTTGATA